MTARALFAFACAAAVSLASAEAHACDCSTPTREVEYARAVQVVVVRIDAGTLGAHAERDGRPRSATLPVERRFKGSTEKSSVEVKLSAGKDCMYFPAEPGRHVVYLHAHHGEGAPLEASDCGHNALVTSARGIEELAALEVMSRDAASAPVASSAPSAPSAAPRAQASAASPAPPPPSRGCAGCTTGAPPVRAPLAITLGFGAIVALWRRRGSAR